MSDTKTVTPKKAVIPAIIFAAVYLLGCVGFFGIPDGILKLFGLSLFLICTGRRGYPIVIVPTVFTAVSGYLSGSPDGTLLALISVISYAACAAVIYEGYASRKNKALICALGGFVMTCFSVISSAVSFLLAAKLAGMRFTTFIFESLDKLINAYITLYETVLENAVNALPEVYAAQAQLPEIDTEAMYSSLTLIITLLPAIMYCIYFALCFICASLVNRTNKKLALIPDALFGKYNVSGVTHGIFTLLGTILVFSLFFDSKLSSFTLGILSVVIAILPHFIIFAYRRLYRGFVRFCGKGGAVILLTVISGAAFFMAPFLALCILAFIGTHEYRAQRIIKIIR